MKNKIQTVALSMDQPYLVPSDFSFIKKGSSVILIRPEYARWVVLNDVEYDAFKMLQREDSLRSTIMLLANTYNKTFDWALFTIKGLLIQLEANGFGASTYVEVNRHNNLYILLTSECNLRCKHCYLKAGLRTPDEWEQARWIDIISQFAALGGEGITLSGGEPSLSLSFKSVVNHAKSLGFRIAVLSNGVNWEPDIAELCFKSVDEIQFNLDGPDEGTHEFIRGKGTYKPVLENIHRALTSGIKVVLAMTPTQETLPSFHQHFKSMAKSFLDEYPNNLKIKIAQRLLPVRDSIVAGTLSMEEYLVEGRLLLEQVYPNYAQESFFSDHPMGLLHRNCGYSELTIGPNGLVFPCNRIDEVDVISDLNHQPLAEVIKVAKNLNEMTSVESMLPCKNCDLRFICGGGCRIDDLSKNGDIMPFVKCSTGHKEHILNMMIETRELYAKQV